MEQIIEFLILYIFLYHQSQWYIWRHFRKDGKLRREKWRESIFSGFLVGRGKKVVGSRVFSSSQKKISLQTEDMFWTQLALPNVTFLDFLIFASLFFSIILFLFFFLFAFSFATILYLSSFFSFFFGMIHASLFFFFFFFFFCAWLVIFLSSSLFFSFFLFFFFM